MNQDERLRALVALAASRHNAFTSFEAASLHIPPQRLRRLELRGEVRRLHPRVWSFVALPSTERQRVLAAIRSLPGSAASTTTAAWLHGWLTEPPIPQLWYPKRETRNHPVADLRRWQRIDPDVDISEVSGIPTLNRAAALCSLGPAIDVSDLERCVDAFLRTDSRRWLDETAARLGSHKPSGVAALRSILDDPQRIGGITDSWFERVVAQLITTPWLPPIELQHDVRTPTGRFRIDIACPELRLGIEAHSRTFHWGADKVDADNVRDIALLAEGWQLLYVTWSQIREPDDFVRSFRKAARSRAELLRVELPAA